MADSVDRYPDSRIVRGALDEVRAIRTILGDVYKDAGDGRTVLRELVQNSDDAEASRVAFLVLDEGWSDADNTLLRGPSLVVMNDGGFPESDRDALHRALGGSKEEDAGKVGRFGIGLKSVFHLCEAFLYLGRDEGVWRPGVVNPWAGTAGGKDDPIHSDWDRVTDSDLERLQLLWNALAQGGPTGLLTWLPLRQAEHRDRSDDGVPYGLSDLCPDAAEVFAWLDRPDPLALLLAQAGHLEAIEWGRVASAEDAVQGLPLRTVARSDFSSLGWLGRPRDDSESRERRFAGEVDSEERQWRVSGSEAVGSEALRSLRATTEWPSDLQWRKGRNTRVPRKAVAHAAMTVFRPDGSDSGPPASIRLRWAVFLPLDDTPDVLESSERVEVLRTSGRGAPWDIVLHGYFWPSQDRRSIPGVTVKEDAVGEAAVRVKWNQGVRDHLLLPLLPSVLEKVVGSLPESVALEVVRAISGSRVVAEHAEVVCSRHYLLPVAITEGVAWTAVERSTARVLLLPDWSRAPAEVRQFLGSGSSGKGTAPFVFIDDPAPRIGGTPESWPSDVLSEVLEQVPADGFRARATIQWLGRFLRHVLRTAEGTDARLVAVARWLAHRIGQGALDAAINGAEEEANALRDSWKELLSSLPAAWVVPAPVRSHRAIVELATAGLTGEGLLPVPLDRTPEAEGHPAPDPVRLRDALRWVGNRLHGDPEASQRLRQSRLVLAETLLSVGDDIELDEELANLPLIRARRLPDDRDDAWSMEELLRRSDELRAFSRPGFSDAEDESTPSVSDPKQALKAFSLAMGTAAWMVSPLVARRSATRVPTPEVLAEAVNAGGATATNPPDRLDLLRRLVPAAELPVVQQAIRILLSGGGDGFLLESPLYYVPDEAPAIGPLASAAETLLHLLGRGPHLIPASLVDPLPIQVIRELDVRPVSLDNVGELLDEAVSREVDWGTLNRARTLDLLRGLFTSEGDGRARWRRMPLHRDATGHRGPLDARVLRPGAGVGLPEGLSNTIRLLDPDPEVEHLYSDVPTLGEESLLRLTLRHEQPWIFVGEIVALLQDGGEGAPSLPRDPEVRSLLRERPWLPPSEGDGAGVAPDQLLLIPESLRERTRPLAKAGAFGGRSPVEDVEPGAWGEAEPVVEMILGRMTPRSRLAAMAAALVPAIIVDRCPDFLILPDSSGVDAHFLEIGLQTQLVGPHRGWGLLHQAAGEVGVQGGRSAESGGSEWNALLLLAHALCGPIPWEIQASMLEVLGASRPGRESPAGELFRLLLGRLAIAPEFFQRVLPSLFLPTQDGSWRPAREIARSESGVARRHRVLPELRETLRLDKPLPPRSSTESPIAAWGVGETLRTYFDPWADRIPPASVGAFLSLLGEGDHGDIRTLAEEWLGEDVSLDVVRADLLEESRRGAEVKVMVAITSSNNGSVEVPNLLGDLVVMGVDHDGDSMFMTDPERERSELGDYWTIRLRGIRAEELHQGDLQRILSNAVDWWATRVLRVDREATRAWWRKWGTGSQAQIAPVRASVLAHLPLTLAQLDVRGDPDLSDALNRAQRAQSKRGQLSTSELSGTELAVAHDEERRALTHLSALIRDNPEKRQFLWGRVSERIRQFGYREDSVLLELAQNADDALADAAEILGGPLDQDARNLTIRVREVGDEIILEVIHHGRPINDTGGASFPAGRNRQWDQDLYYMMLLNLSGKPGESPGRDTGYQTTGRFGLGFKSVHLVSSDPFVVSGFTAFSISGGLLPEESPVPVDHDKLSRGGRPATLIRLPLRTDTDRTALLDSLFARFGHAQALVPVFARQVRRVIVEGGPQPGLGAFLELPVPDAPGWAIGNDPIEINGSGPWTILRFRPSDAGTAAGSTALALGLRDGLVSAFPDDLPFLWNTTPTSEAWGCGYAVNGPFKLDPGRTHVSLEDPETRAVVRLLGQSLGEGLVSLHDRVASGGCSFVGEPGDFTSSLWEVLSRAVHQADPHRRAFLQTLHGPGLGLSAWVTQRSVVPSGLPAPFRDRLPPLDGGVRLRVAKGGLGDRQVCRAMAGIPALASTVESHWVVSPMVADRLSALLGVSGGWIEASEIMTALMEGWSRFLSAERLRSLRPLSDEAVWSALTEGDRAPPWLSGLKALSAAGERRELRDLLVPTAFDGASIEADLEEEQLRAAFAPAEHVLDPEYLKDADDLSLFVRLRVRHRVDSEMMTGWVLGADEERRPDAVRYLVRGRLRSEILTRLLSSGARPDWLASYDSLKDVLDGLGEEPWQCHALLAALFPERMFVPEAPPIVPPQQVRQDFFERLEEWWDDQDVRHAVIGAHEARVWPDWLRDGLGLGLREGSDDHWMGLLVLGAARGLGRTRPEQHRSFLELAHREGWWEVFLDPERPSEWMAVLRMWQDKAVQNLTYSPWMSLFPTIYQLSRYRHVYRRLINTVGRRPEEAYRLRLLLSPRADEALTGAGHQFDAPPASINFGMHWILRELVRMEVIEQPGDHLLPDCWVPAEGLINFLLRLGFDQQPDGLSNLEKARAIHAFMSNVLDVHNPHLHLAFDIPLRAVERDHDLQRRLGLED